MAIITPYDNKIALWQHAGQVVSEQSIDELAQTVRRYAPAVSQIWVKTSDGSDWMGKYDTKPALAIDGPDAIKRWVTTLQKYGLEFHAWCVPHGLDIDGESSVIAQTCQVPGVRSVILDVEPYPGFFQGGRAAVRPLMTRVRSQIPGAFHIGMAVDPRPQHFASIFPDEWFPFVGSVHLQLYWGEFQVSPDSALATGYQTWGSYKRPIFPILQAYNVDAASMERARSLAVNTYKSIGVSYWALGHIDQSRFAAVNRNLDGSSAATPPGATGGAIQHGVPITVKPGGTGYADGVYTGQFSTYASASGGTGKFTPTNDHVANVWARWDPQIKQSGWCTVEAFVPNQHATTGKARYRLSGVQGQPRETVLTLPQYYYHNEWAPLGMFQINTSAPQAGMIYLTDWTFEPGLEIAFDAIRYRPVLEPGAFRVLSGITPRAREIYLKGKSLGNRANVFSRVGDSITASPLFLTPIGENRYDLGAFTAELLPVVQYFLPANARAGNSFANPSLAAGNGWGADRIIQAGYAYTDVCGNEVQLVCEYKRVRPALALIMIGTNDSGGVAPQEFTANLRHILDISIDMGVLPVLSTIPPKRNDSWNAARAEEWNGIIRGLAEQYMIPLWDYWYALQGLPNLGLSPDGIHPSEPPDGRSCHFTAQNLNYGYTVRNLVALRALDALWRQVMF